MKEEKFVPEKLTEIMQTNVMNLKGSYGKPLNELVKDIADECKSVSDPDK